MDASEIHARRLNATGSVNAHENEKIVFPVANGTVKISGGDRRENIHLNPRGEEQEILRGESGGLFSIPTSI